MNVDKKNRLKKGFANFFGALGYFSCSLQWIWILVLYFSFINKIALDLSPISDNKIVEPVVKTIGGPGPELVVMAAIITVAIIIMTIIILIKLPSAISKTSQAAVHKTAEGVAPLILKFQHKKDTKKNQLKLTPTLIIWLKLSLLIIPIILSFTSIFLEKQMFDYKISIFIGLWLAGFSAIFFVIQYILFRLLSIAKKEII